MSTATRRCAIATLLIAVMLATSAPAAAGAPPERSGPTQIIVGWSSASARATAERALDGHGLSIARRLYGGRTALVDVPSGSDAVRFAARVAALPGVAYAEPDYPVSAAWTPNDPYFNAIAPALNQWGPRRIGAELAWNATVGTGVTIAIIDTGVDLTHPDLAAKLDTANDYDFINLDTSAQDDNGHGTHCAGIAAAITNNGIGVAGMAPGATILPIKTLDSAGNGSTANLAAGIDWAVAHGADVVSMSLGGKDGTVTLQSAVERARAAGVVVVAATGNLNAGVFYPAAYPDVIAVGATDVNDVRSSYSNKGPEIDVVAPGGTSGTGIISAVVGGYGVKYGTSMATPHVAGVVALMRSAAPSADATEITAALSRTSRDLGGAGFDVLNGAGLVQAADAIIALTTTDTLPPVTTTDATTDYNDTATIAFAATDAGTGVAWTYSVLDGGSVATVPGLTVTGAGAHTIDVWSADRAGNAEPPTRLALTVHDTIPPVTITDAKAQYQVAADIRLYPSDSGTGIAQTYSRLDGGAVTVGSRVIVPSANRTVPESHVLEYWARDLAGNVEVPHTVSFEVGDYVAPVTTTNAVATYGNAPATIKLAATDDGFGVTETRWSLDGAPASMGATVTVGAGVHTLAFASVDAAGNREATRTAGFRVYGRADVRRIAASNRYGTAAALSRSAFADGSVPTAVIASGEGFADALAASGLAGVLSSPVLLTARDRVPAELAAELDRLGAAKAIVIGGEAVVDPAVEVALGSLGLTVERIAGRDRYATAAAVASRIRASSAIPPDGVFIARGDQFADALAVSPLAYAARYPVLLVREGALPVDTGLALSTLGASHVVLVGGTAALSADVESQVQVAAAAPVTRIAGSNRYQTAAHIAAFGRDRGLATGAYIGVATGSDFPDALAGGAAAGVNGGVLLLTGHDTLSNDARGFIAGRGSAGTPVRLFGGTTAVSDAVRAALAAIPLL